VTGATVGVFGNEGAGADDGPAGLRLEDDGIGDVVGLTLMGSAVGSNVSGHSSLDLLDFDDLDDGALEYFEDPFPPFPFPVDDGGLDLLPFPPFPLEGALEYFEDPFPPLPFPVDDGGLDLLPFPPFPPEGASEYFEDPFPPLPFPVDDGGLDLLPFPPFPLEGVLVFDVPFPLPLDGRRVLDEPFPDPLPRFEEFGVVDFEDEAGPAVVVTSMVDANGF
jgi:hypothetical protein